MHVYSHVFDEFRMVGSEGTSIADEFVQSARWLEMPGCVFQRNDLVLGTEISTRRIIKAGFFVTVVLKRDGQGGPRHAAGRFRYADNTIVVMALREPTLCAGFAPKGAPRCARPAWPFR